MKIKIFQYHLPVKDQKLLKSLKDTKLVVMSDTHFKGSDYDKERWPHILEEVKKRKPTAIILAGDTVDSADIVDDSHALHLLKTLLKKLVKIAPVYIGIGNHDFHVFTKRNMMLESQEHFEKLLDFYSKIKGVTVLHDKNATIGKLNLIGITLPHKYYYHYKHYNRINENHGLLRKIMRSGITKGKNDYYNLALIHSPYLLDNSTIRLAPELDLIIAGHAHNGCVPPLLSKLWRGDRGLASAGKRPLAKRSRNTFKSSKGKLATLGPVTTLADTLNELDKYFPSEIAEFTFSSDPFISAPKSCIIKT